MGRRDGPARRRFEHPFRDRHIAGRVLASLLSDYSGRTDLVVLGLARGGIPVAREVATGLQAPLDVAVVRKLGVPGHEELALGALAGAETVINDMLVRRLAITDEQLAGIIERERRELARREIAYRAGRPPVDVAGRWVILVDDGLATGASMRAAAKAVRRAQPAGVVIAVPTAPVSAGVEFAGLADAVVCAATPRPFTAVGMSYLDFGQVSDAEVQRELAASAAT